MYCNAIMILHKLLYCKMPYNFRLVKKQYYVLIVRIDMEEPKCFFFAVTMSI